MTDVLKKILGSSAGLVIALLMGADLLSAEEFYPPKHEFRAAYITTVWAIDWPKKWNSPDYFREQQAQMVQMLDSFKRGNLNAVYFQARGFCDAMYKSKYEPWSRYLTGTRGAEPKYDPLAFLLKEAHSRGIAVYCWINPYRYATSSDTYGTLPTDYANTHPEWLLYVDQYTCVLNPSMDIVKKRVQEVVGDIINTYDVDGLIMDDYFYPSGGFDSKYDAEIYQTNNPKNLSLADWRRDNVNQMLKMVYDTIQAVKPWVKLGMAPPPQCASSQNVADKYGVEKFPYADWQYNGQYSDPLAWYQQGTVDFMSPQMYYKIKSNYDYTIFCRWWSKVSNQFWRHVYPSGSLSGMSGTNIPSKMQGRHKAAQASFGVTEIGAEIQLDRDMDRNDAPGYAMYSVMEGVNMRGFFTYIRNFVNTRPALPPTMAWKLQTNQLFVRNIHFENGKLAWDAPSPATGLSYAFYCVPKDSIGKLGTFASSKYLEAYTYDTYCNYQQKSGYTYAVSVIDRYGNEYAPLVLNGKITEPTTNSSTIFPHENDNPLLPTFFTWSSVPNADSYFFELSEKAAFDSVLFVHEVLDTMFFTGELTSMRENQTYYWRVRTRVAGEKDSYSDIASFTGEKFKLQSPANGEEHVSLTPWLVCDSVHTNLATYEFEVSTSSMFSDKDIVFKGSANVPRIQIPENILTQTTNFYYRVKVSFGGVMAQTDEYTFKTMSLPVPVPELLTPEHGAVLKGTDVTVTWKEQNAKSFRVEMSTTSTFGSRSTKAKIVDGYTYEVTYENVEPGVYYLRVKATGEEGYTEPSEMHSFTLESGTSLEQNESETKEGKCYDLLGRELEKMSRGQVYIQNGQIKTTF